MHMFVTLVITVDVWCDRCWHLPYSTRCWRWTPRGSGSAIFLRTATSSTLSTVCCRTMTPWEACCLRSQSRYVLSTSSSPKLYAAAVVISADCTSS